MNRTVAQVDFSARRQTVDGFGLSLAFQRARLLSDAGELPPEARREVLDLLFSTSCGAGFSILRLGIGASATYDGNRMKSIQPHDPGGPDAPPRYQWDGDDGGQVWLAREAQRYGVTRIYASAWGAPGYMKTNGVDYGGGVLHGLPGSDSAGIDWRRAYADYLIQYVRFMREEGVTITDLGFVNEPDLVVNVPHLAGTETETNMCLDEAQVVDFVKVLGPAVRDAGLPLRIVCCDAMRWSRQIEYTRAIEADPVAADWVGIHAGHCYEGRAGQPLPTTKPTWVSEWDPGVGRSRYDYWEEAWDGPILTSGMRLAEHVHDMVTRIGVNGYLYWFGASSGGTRALVQVEGDKYRVSKRLWAMASYSRFVRPGASRVEARPAPGGPVKLSAFQNADGTQVVNLLNLFREAVDIELDVVGLCAAPVLKAYVTDESRSLDPVGPVRLKVDVEPGVSRIFLPAPARSQVVLTVSGSRRREG